MFTIYSEKEHYRGVAVAVLETVKKIRVPSSLLPTQSTADFVGAAVRSTSLVNTVIDDYDIDTRMIFTVKLSRTSS